MVMPASQATPDNSRASLLMANLHSDRHIRSLPYRTGGVFAENQYLTHFVLEAVLADDVEVD
jgi:hypothetical protein